MKFWSRYNAFFIAATYLDPTYRFMSFISDSHKRNEYITNAKHYINSFWLRLQETAADQLETNVTNTSRPSTDVTTSRRTSTGTCTSITSTSNTRPIDRFIPRRVLMRHNQGFLSTLAPSNVECVQLEFRNELDAYERINYAPYETIRDKMKAPLDFFRKYLESIPKLCRVARCILSVPASSVPSISLNF